MQKHNQFAKQYPSRGSGPQEDIEPFEIKMTCSIRVLTVLLEYFNFCTLKSEIIRGFYPLAPQAATSMVLTIGVPHLLQFLNRQN